MEILKEILSILNSEHSQIGSRISAKLLLIADKTGKAPTDEDLGKAVNLDVDVVRSILAGIHENDDDYAKLENYVSCYLKQLNIFQSCSTENVQGNATDEINTVSFNKEYEESINNVNNRTYVFTPRGKDDFDRLSLTQSWFSKISAKNKSQVSKNSAVTFRSLGGLSYV